MPVQYLIKKVETCPVCKGEERVQHPAWEQFWKAHPIDEPVPCHEEMRRWFDDNGWIHPGMMDIGTDGLPDEEIYCSECEGQGEIVSEVDLRAALLDISETEQIAK